MPTNNPQGHNQHTRNQGKKTAGGASSQGRETRGSAGNEKKQARTSSGSKKPH